jgi:hypothetical protein
VQIQTTDEIEGVPLLKIRALFRQAFGAWTALCRQASSADN